MEDMELFLLTLLSHVIPMEAGLEKSVRRKNSISSILDVTGKQYFAYSHSMKWSTRCFPPELQCLCLGNQLDCELHQEILAGRRSIRHSHNEIFPFAILP